MFVIPGNLLIIELKGSSNVIILSSGELNVQIVHSVHSSVSLSINRSFLMSIRILKL